MSESAPSKLHNFTNKEMIQPHTLIIPNLNLNSDWGAYLILVTWEGFILERLKDRVEFKWFKNLISRYLVSRRQEKIKYGYFLFDNLLGIRKIFYACY